jgi:hypothetical protein
MGAEDNERNVVVTVSPVVRGQSNPEVFLEDWNRSRQDKPLRSDASDV